MRPVRSLREFFKDSVAESMERQNVDADDHTAYYVVNLLTLFARSEALFDRTSEGIELKPLARVLAESIDSDRREVRNHALQRVGDVSLFLAGFLGDGFATKLVDIDYYVHMGEAAYDTLSRNVRGSRRGEALSAVFAELAEKFQAFVDVLADIRDAEQTTGTDTLRLYETWLRTGSRRAAELLRAQGIEPLDAGNLQTHH